MGKKTKNAKKNKFVVAEEENEVNIGKAAIVAKKAKKNKIVETALENNNETELSAPKPQKAMKIKSVPPEAVATVNDVGKLAKKGKKNKKAPQNAALTAPNVKKAKKHKLQTPKEESNESNEEEDSADENETVPTKKIKKEKKTKQNGAGDGEVAKTKEQNKFLQFSQGVTEDMIARYPVLNDEALINQFLAVRLTGTQKGRMRQIFKSSLQGTPEDQIPELIHSRIQIILKTPTLTETAHRKLRVLTSMLKTALMTTNPNERKTQGNERKVVEKKEGGDEQKKKGPKRWIVFIGNLPLGITDEKIKEHFSDLGDDNIKDIRIPKKKKDPKSAIAYMEVSDNLHFELALSKHHTMLDNRRINVLYTAQSGSKMSTTEAKGKAAKLVALQKLGKLAGSIPLSKKRSARRKKMKEAKKAEAS